MAVCASRAWKYVFYIAFSSSYIDVSNCYQLKVTPGILSHNVTSKYVGCSKFPGLYHPTVLSVFFFLFDYIAAKYSFSSEFKQFYGL